MTTSQSDVDKVMAAFGAAPITYRPNQDTAAGWDPRPTAAKGEAPAVTDRAASSAQSPERILPGAGGRVREIFPLLWRAIPVVGDLKVGATKRPGDEVPDKEPVSVADQILAARLQAAGAQTPGDAAAPRALADRPVPPTVPEAEGDPAVDQQSPAQWARQEHEAAPAAPPAPVPVAAVPPRPPQPLRSHADMIRPVGPKDPRPAPSALPPQAQLPPPPAYQPPPQAAAYPQSPQGYQPPPAYPPYYPPPAMPSYPAYPGAAGWPQPAYPQPYAQPYPPAPYTPPPYTPPPYPQMGGGYPPAYPPGYPPAYQPAYPTGIPYGYPPPTAAYAPAFPPAYGAPPPHPQQSPPPPAGAPQPQPQPAAAASSPASLSDIFAALHRGRSKDRGQETPQ